MKRMDGRNNERERESACAHMHSCVCVRLECVKMVMGRSKTIHLYPVPFL